VGVFEWLIDYRASRYWDRDPDAG